MAVGETTRALAAAEIALKEAPTLDVYQRVRELAGDAWPTHRDTLLAHLRRLPGSMSGAVEIPLDEGLIKDAMAVVDRGASHTLLERVAEAAVPSHPEWVIKTSRREAEDIMDHDGPPLLDEVAMLQSTATILNHAEAEGTRNAGLFAALLVFLGALCSLLIPNPEKTRGPGDDGIPDTHGEWDVAPPANTELHEQTP